MGWQSTEFGSFHEGSVGVLLADGGEPGPVWLNSGSGSGGLMVSEWWVYDGRLGAQRAASLRGACSCGWRGARDYPVDWIATVGWPRDIDISGPHADWRQHVEQVLAEDERVAGAAGELHQDRLVLGVLVDRGGAVFPANTG